LKGDYNSFYRDSLRYLGCIDLNDLTSQQQQEHAFHIGLSALLGDKVGGIIFYNHVYDLESGAELMILGDNK